MAANNLETTESLRGLVLSQGGDYHLEPATMAYPSESTTYMSAVHPPANYMPFVISLYNVETDEARYPLNLLVNPTDVQYGHAKAVNNAYTRKGWVTSYWGSQPRTLTVSASSAGFYYNPNQVAETVEGLGIKVGGLSNYGRRNSIAFANLLAVISFYKRNGAYFLNDVGEQTYWKDGTSRVINVMDFVMVSYDGSDHVGAFSTFTVDDSATRPYRIEYNFEFVVAGLRGDFFDGHLRKADNDLNPRVEISTQGDDMELTKTVRMDEDELNKYYEMAPVKSQTLYDVGSDPVDAANDPPTDAKKDYWTDSKGVKHPVSVVPEGQVRVSRGGLDGEPHKDKNGNINLKIDYRTGSGEIRSLSSGVVVVSQLSTEGEWYVVVKTKVPYNGEMVDGYVKYYHLDPALANVVVGSVVEPGSSLGFERYEGSVAYPPHCDLQVIAADESKPGWQNGETIDPNDYFLSGVNTLSTLTTFPDGALQEDYQEVKYKHGEKATAADQQT